MIDFPASPTQGQQFTAVGITWTWDGAKWTPTGAPSAFAPAMNDNRIINGDMRIAQRGTNGSTIQVYTVDRWSLGGTQSGKLNWAQNNVGPANFPYYTQIQSLSAFTSAATDYFNFAQPIEADMISDFAWGTPSAQPVTLSFWVGTSVLTGTFSGSIFNYAGTRSYPFTFSIPAVSTWYRIVVTIPGDTSGTWVMKGNVGSLFVGFDLGSGVNYRGSANAWAGSLFTGVAGAQSIVATNGAIFSITGVKLEIGSVATPYNHYSLAKCMADCQRYYNAMNRIYINNYATGSVAMAMTLTMPTMRVAPTITLANVSYNNGGGAATQQSMPGSFNAYFTPTAAGNAYSLADYLLSAEL